MGGSWVFMGAGMGLQELCDLEPQSEGVEYRMV